MAGRKIMVGAAQMGPIQKSEPRVRAVARMVELLRQAAARGCRFVVFPELALTTFFPRWLIQDAAELDGWFESDMPNLAVMPLFRAASELGIGFYLGYAEIDRSGSKKRRFNSSILVDPAGRILGKYRKVHLPGHAEVESERTFQHLEKRYFEVGDLGFPVWRMLGGVFGMCICNDRRWPETFRVMGLQGVELVAIGYNTPTTNALGHEPAYLRAFHNHLAVQAGAYQNSTWVVSVAKAGVEDGHDLLAGSCIVAPSGEIVALARTDEDELIVAECDLDACEFYKRTTFNFQAHRRPEHYRMIVERTGAKPPD
jgi:N-carbamoyl-D-amino-acid hydrolase